MFAPSASIRKTLPMMCRLHMQYFGSRVELKAIRPSGRYSGSKSLTPAPKVSCVRPLPSARIS